MATTQTLSPLHEGAATDHVLLTSTPSLVAVGVQPVDAADLGSLVVRVELALFDRERHEHVWFDAGAALDLDDSTRTMAVPVAGYDAVRLAVRTAASDAGVEFRTFIGVPV